MIFYNNPIPLKKKGERALQPAGKSNVQPGASLSVSASPSGEVNSGNKSITLFMHNKTNKVIWVAVRGQFHSGSPGVATMGWETRAWYRIDPGQKASPGDLATNLFYFFANDQGTTLWEGDFENPPFVDGVGIINEARKFTPKPLSNDWLTHSEYTLELLPPGP
jgi:hypothetical protein